VPRWCATTKARCIRYEGTVRDITDQRRAEDAIAEGRRLLQMVIDTVPAVINVKDKGTALRPDEPLYGRHFRGRAAGRDRPDHRRPDVALLARPKTDENDKRVLTVRRELGFYEEEYKDSAGNMRQWLRQQAADRGRRRRDREHRHRRARHRRRKRGEQECARPAMPPKPRCAICAKPRIR